jgi:hypothetical protein
MKELTIYTKEKRLVVASYFDFKVLEYTLVKRDNIDNAV